MKPSILLALSAVILSAAVTYAVASNDDVRKRSGEPWLPKQQIEAQFNQMGYQVNRLKADDGCIEAYVTDRNGARTELYLDPMTGKPGCRGKYEDRDS